MKVSKTCNNYAKTILLVKKKYDEYKKISTKKKPGNLATYDFSEIHEEIPFHFLKRILTNLLKSTPANKFSKFYYFCDSKGKYRTFKSKL